MIKFKNERLEKLPLKKNYIFSILLSIFIVACGLLAQLILPPEIPLFYGQPQNEEQLAKSIFIILPSVVSLFIAILNAYISTLIESTYLKKVLSLISISISILAAVTTFKIIFLVGNI